MAYTKQGFKDGQKLTAEHLNKMESGIEEALNKEGGVSSWNDLTDKPFGETIVEIFPETTVPMSENMGTIETDFQFEVGEEYELIWNGAKYSCVCKELSVNGATGGYGIGNIGAMMGAPTSNETFLMVSLLPEFATELGANFIVGDISESGLTEVTIELSKKSIVKLEKEYMDLEPDLFDFSSYGTMTSTATNFSSIEGITGYIVAPEISTLLAYVKKYKKANLKIACNFSGNSTESIPIELEVNFVKFEDGYRSATPVSKSANTVEYILIVLGSTDNIDVMSIDIVN